MKQQQQQQQELTPLNAKLGAKISIWKQYQQTEFEKYE